MSATGSCLHLCLMTPANEGQRVKIGTRWLHTWQKFVTGKTQIRFGKRYRNTRISFRDQVECPIAERGFLEVVREGTKP